MCMKTTFPLLVCKLYANCVHVEHIPRHIPRHTFQLSDMFVQPLHGGILLVVGQYVTVDKYRVYTATYYVELSVWKGQEVCPTQTE